MSEAHALLDSDLTKRLREAAKALGAAHAGHPDELIASVAAAAVGLRDSLNSLAGTGGESIAYLMPALVHRMKERERIREALALPADEPVDAVVQIAGRYRYQALGRDETLEALGRAASELRELKAAAPLDAVDRDDLREVRAFLQRTLPPEHRQPSDKRSTLALLTLLVSWMTGRAAKEERLEDQIIYKHPPARVLRRALGVPDDAPGWDWESSIRNVQDARAAVAGIGEFAGPGIAGHVERICEEKIKLLEQFDDVRGRLITMLGGGSTDFGTATLGSLVRLAAVRLIDTRTRSRRWYEAYGQARNAIALVVKDKTNLSKLAAHLDELVQGVDPE